MFLKYVFLILAENAASLFDFCFSKEGRKFIVIAILVTIFFNKLHRINRNLERIEQAVRRIEGKSTKLW
jgi:hypothetical protein